MRGWLMVAFTLARAVQSELLIKKSRFLGCVEPVAGRAPAGRAAAKARVGEGVVAATGLGAEPTSSDTPAPSA